jgi:methyltransferase
MRLAERHSRKLLAEGAVEHGREHYPIIVALHAAWLAALWWWAPGRTISIPLLVLFAVLQIGRVWVIRSLGDRWTTRIIVKPGAPLVRRGPYRFVNHPNYLIVAAEIAVLPLVFGLCQIAVLFSALNAIVLTVRIRVENRALASLRG